MKTVALEDLVASTILGFCENLAELGCPRTTRRKLNVNDDITPDMWYRYLTPDEQRKVASKLLEIEERDYKSEKKEQKRFTKAAKDVHKESVKTIKNVEKAHKKTAKSKLIFGKK